MKRNCFLRASQKSPRKISLPHKIASLAGIILLMIATPPTLPAGQYDLKGSIEAAKQQEHELREKAKAAEERMHAHSKRLYEQLTDPDGKYKLSREQAISILKSKRFLVDRL